MESKQKLVTEMLAMQRALDSAIYKAKNVEFDCEKCTLALMDEIGEFIHETKNGWVDRKGEVHSGWCWWKDKFDAPSREKMIEEFADCMHFALSLCYHWHDAQEENIGFKLHLANKDAVLKNADVSMLITRIMISTGYSVVECLLEMGWKYDIELEDVYKAYIEKNKENYNRLERGY